MRNASACALLTCALLANQPAAEEVVSPTTIVTVARDGDVYLVDSISRIAATQEVAWQVLTDYERYADYVPGVTLSRRLGGNPLRVEQQGLFRVLFLRKFVHMTLEVEEHYPDAIRFRAVEGNLRSLNTEIEVFPGGKEIVLSYRSRIEPGFWIPGFIGSSLLRAAIQPKLAAVAEEIARRAALEKTR